MFPVEYNILPSFFISPSLLPPMRTPTVISSALLHAFFEGWWKNVDDYIEDDGTWQRRLNTLLVENVTEHKEHRRGVYHEHKAKLRLPFAFFGDAHTRNRKSVVKGKSESVRVDPGGRGRIKQKKTRSKRKIQ